MSTKVGSAWENTTDGGKTCISIKFNEESLPLILKDDSSLTLWPNEVNENTPEKAPQYSVSLSKYKPKEQA